MTKAQKIMLNSYNYATCTKLEQLYKSYSKAKKYAAIDCWHIMHAFNGYDMRFYSATSFHFTCGFKWFDGKHEHLHVETSRDTYDFIIDE